MRRLTRDGTTYAFGTMQVVLALYCAGLVIDLVIGCAFRFRRSPFALEADEREYFTMAQDILSGALQITPRRTLGFPLIETIPKLFTDNFIVLQSFITTIYALSAPLLFVLVQQLTSDRRIAMTSALALMLWPPALYYGISLYSEAVAMPMILLFLILLPKGSRICAPPAHRAAMAVVSGMILALATHVRPMYLLFLPVTLIIVLWEEQRLDRAIARFALVLAGFALFVAPWSIFMSTRFHHTILVTSNGGETLSGGLNPELLKIRDFRPIKLADRTAWVGPGKWLPIADNGYLTDADRGLSYEQMDALLKARTIRWVEDHPADAAYLEFNKLRYMWGFGSFDDTSPLQTWAGAVPTILVLFAALASWLAMPSLRGRYARLWLLPLFVSGVALVSWGSWRFRQVGDAGLIALCAIALFAHLDRTFRPATAPAVDDLRKSYEI